MHEFEIAQRWMHPSDKFLVHRCFAAAANCHELHGIAAEGGIEIARSNAGVARVFAHVAEADATGTSPGKEALRSLLEQYSPCVVLIDELVAYVRQFPESQAISGGSYDSNLSFVQALTEAVKLVPRAIVLASLPESEVEAGSQRGVAALRALEKTFGRVQALWKPVATEEAFEIVRRRLFEPVRDEKAREEICRAFADAYISEGAKLPAETQERRYFDRLQQAYPIHPEVFDRLYEDWTTIDGFQRTRGVLKLMAKVIFRLWKDDNRDLLIMPGSLPLHDGGTRNELTYYLPAGWDPVIERDIDGDRAETTALENKEPRFGQVGAARRIARTIFLGSAPATAKMHLVNLADEIIALLASDPNANVRLTVEISAEFPDGASDSIKRAVLENANSGDPM